MIYCWQCKRTVDPVEYVNHKRKHALMRCPYPDCLAYLGKRKLKKQ